MSKRSPLLVAFALCLALGGCGPDAGEPVAATASGVAGKTYTVLDESLSQLRQNFNAHRGKVRLLFVVGDTCGICLRGMADLNDAFLARAQTDGRLLTLVVHVPTLGAEERHVPEAMQLLRGPRVRHYWDGSGMTGMHLVETLDTGGIYAWDVWLAYGPEAEWNGPEPPPPAFWMHQLGGLDDDLRLDAGLFGGMTLELMQELSAETWAESGPSEVELLADGAVISSVAQPKGRAIATHVRGVGGEGNLQSVRTIIRSGTIQTPSGSTSVRVGHDREKGLSRDYADPSKGLPAKIEARLAASWEMDGLLVGWRDKGHQVRMSGMRKIGTSLAWKLFLRQASDLRWALYVDSHTGDLVLKEALDDDGRLQFFIRAVELREFEGIRMPVTLEYHAADGTLLATEHYAETRILR